jgi:outer membrane receptor protein involved in Fe transport
LGVARIVGCTPSRRQRLRPTAKTVRWWCLFVVLISTVAVRAEVPRVLPADIPGQPLADALNAYAQQTGLQLAYVSEIALGKTSKGTPAGLSPAAALARLLEGTGLQFEFLSQRSVRILAAAEAVPAITPVHTATIEPEEILITATKRVESLATVPMNVNVLSSSDVQAQGITGIEDLAARISGLEYDFSSQFGSGTVTNVALRGINSRSGQSTTALYIDDAPIHAWDVGTAFGNPYPVVFDLARVEILRGPQGTLFGTGAEGGAIRFITNTPSTTTYDAFCQTQVSATRHGDPSLEAGCAMGGPLTKDHLGARVSAWYQHEGGFVDRVNPFTLATVDENSNSNSTALFRVAFAFTPGDAVRIMPSYTYQAHDIHDSPNFYVYLSSPDAGVLRNGKLLRQPATDKFSLAALRIEADVAAATLISATSYFDRTSDATVDQTNQAGVAFFGGFGNPLGPAYPSSYADAVANVQGARQSVFSQELRLTTKDSFAPFNWVVGVFYGRSHMNSNDETYLVVAPESPGLYGLESTIDTDIAAFGDATLAVSRRWRLNLGARLEQTRTDTEVHESGYANPVTVPYYRNAGDTGSSLAPRVAISYVPDDGDLLYVSASKGFRAGGLNVPECGAPPKFAPDSVWSYEAGAKGSAFSNRMWLAASIFYARWSAIQQLISTTASCFVDYTSNLGDAVSRGFDLTAQGLLTEHLYVEFDVGFLEAKYLNTIKSGSSVIVEEGTVVGGLPGVPSPWSLVMRAEYRLPIRQGATLYAGAEEIIHSKNAGPFLESNPQSPSYDTTVFADPATTLLNLRFGIVHEGLDLRVSVLNALNSQPLLQHDSDASGSTLQYAHTFRPRTLALTGTWRF